MVETLYITILLIILLIKKRIKKKDTYSIYFCLNLYGSITFFFINYTYVIYKEKKNDN